MKLGDIVRIISVRDFSFQSFANVLGTTGDITAVLKGLEGLRFVVRGAAYSVREEDLELIEERSVYARFGIGDIVMSGARISDIVAVRLDQEGEVVYALRYGYGPFWVSGERLTAVPDFCDAGGLL